MARRPKTSSVLLKQRSPFERVADFLTNAFGTAWFFILNALVFICWIVVNTGFISRVAIFDPFPFNFLTMFVSLEAIFLSIIVLMSQNRAAKLADIREEIDFQVNVQAEKEITKILRMLDTIEHKLSIEHMDDPELRSMKRTLDIKRIAKRVTKEMNG